MIAMSGSVAVRNSRWSVFAATVAPVGIVAAVLGAMPLAAFAAPVCDAHLSPAQRDLFALTLSPCNAEAVPPTAPAAPHADALVASALRPSAAAQAAGQTTAAAAAAAPLPPESAHLQLFGKPGVVMARMNRASEAAWTSAPRPPPAGSRKGGKAGRPDTAGALSQSIAPPDGPPTGRPISRAEELSPQVDAVARRHDIDPLLLHAIAHVESRHNPLAHSPAGALGVMQVMPATGSRFGVMRPEALHHTGINLDVSAAYLKSLQQRFGNNLSLVLAAYNAGEGAVERHGRRVPPYAETQRYVRDVLERYRMLNQTAMASAF